MRDPIVLLRLLSREPEWISTQTLHCVKVETLPKICTGYSMCLSLLVFTQLLSKVSWSQPAKPARKQNLMRNSQSMLHLFVDTFFEFAVVEKFAFGTRVTTVLTSLSQSVNMNIKFCQFHVCLPKNFSCTDRQSVCCILYIIHIREKSHTKCLCPTLHIIF